MEQSNRLQYLYIHYISQWPKWQVSIFFTVWPQWTGAETVLRKQISAVQSVRPSRHFFKQLFDALPPKSPAQIHTRVSNVIVKKVVTFWHIITYPITQVLYFKMISCKTTWVKNLCKTLVFHHFKFVTLQRWEMSQAVCYKRPVL